MKRVFSGIQPTGVVHVGNYLGAIRNWVALQEEYECFFCIVDYHAITVPYEPGQMAGNVLHMAASLLACGIDPERATLFVQSAVPEHTELCWLFNCVTSVGQLQRMTQFKEKAARHREFVPAGLLNYPILQAADIALYKGEVVPVGEDQLQHLELARDIVRRFNALYGETFPEPQPLLTQTPRVMALNNPEQKMSKSIPGSYIALNEPPDEIRRKVRRAVTDVGPGADRMSPGVKNLFTLLEAFAPPQVVAGFRQAYDQGELRYAELKEALAEALVASLTPIRERQAELLASPARVAHTLREGAARARRVARATLEQARERMGLAGAWR